MIPPLITTFVTKFANDWSINLASMLTYSLLTALVSILVAIFSLAGLVLNRLSPATLQSLAHTIAAALPAGTSQIINVPQLLKHVVQLSGPLGVLSLLGLLWTGSNLFTNVENAFSIVFRTPDRDFLPQRVMAVGMVLLLAVLLPLALVASSLATAGSQAFAPLLPPPLGVILSIVGPLTAVGILWLLFLAIDMVVPNIRVPFHDAWRGALTAAVLVAIVDLIFPLYATLFLNGNAKYGALLPVLLVLIIFLWFFNVILMLGAQVNAVAMGLEATPYDLARTFAQDYQNWQRPAAQQVSEKTPRRSHDGRRRTARRVPPHKARTLPRPSGARRRSITDTTVLDE